MVILSYPIPKGVPASGTLSRRRGADGRADLAALSFPPEPNDVD
jgi:hypothetical protein